MTDLATVAEPGDHTARLAAGANGRTTTVPSQHDSDAWDTVSGWVWVCRTCLDKGFAIGEAHAREMLARHNAGPIPWWVARVAATERHR